MRKWLEPLAKYIIAPLVVAIIGGLAAAYFIGEGARFAGKLETPEATVTVAPTTTQKIYTVRYRALGSKKTSIDLVAYRLADRLRDEQVSVENPWSKTTVALQDDDAWIKVRDWNELWVRCELLVNGKIIDSDESDTGIAECRGIVGS